MCTRTHTLTGELKELEKIWMQAYKVAWHLPEQTATSIFALSLSLSLYLFIYRLSVCLSVCLKTTGRLFSPSRSLPPRCARAGAACEQQGNTATGQGRCCCCATALVCSCCATVIAYGMSRARAGLSLEEVSIPARPRDIPYAITFWGVAPLSHTAGTRE